MRQLAIVGAVTALVVACGDPLTDDGTNATVNVVTTTINGVTVPDGYAVTVDGIEVAMIGPNDSVTLELEPGSHSFGLRDVPSGCDVGMGNPRDFLTESGFTVWVPIPVYCARAIPDYVEIVFVSRQEESSELHGMRADGTGQVNLTGTDDDEDHPAWSPDGTWLAFTRGENIWISAADGSELVRLTQSGVNGGPDWSPDGTLIVFHRTEETIFDNQLWVAAVDRSAVTQLTTGGVPKTQPVWSPDGSAIAFESIRDDGARNVAWVSATGSNVRFAGGATQGGRRFPAWSPDGSRLVFARFCQGVECPTEEPIPGVPAIDETWHLFVVDADGENEREVRRLPGFQFDPSWAPSGSFLIFASQERSEVDGEIQADPFHVHLMNADGTGEVQQLESEHSARWPVWRPRP